MSAPELLYRGELVSYPGPWAFYLPKSAIILVSDAQLIALEDPDQKIDLSISAEPQFMSLREVCEQAQGQGARTLILAFDHFWAQYRPGQAGPRHLMPDMPEYIERMAQISRFIEGYGLGLELSLLSPLEIGRAFHRVTGESGVWMHYRKGLRDPKTGAFSVQLWRHQRWANNKGAFVIEDAGVRVFAFNERAIPGMPYRVVDPARIVEITGDIAVETFDDTAVDTGEGGLRLQRVRVHGRGGAAGPDRVLVVQQYQTPEMDYFSERAEPFLEELVDRYAEAGVKLNALYADETHIQQDWHYFMHHDHGEFALRYVSLGLARTYAERYGEQFADFAKYLIYFCQGQEDFSCEAAAPREEIQHVWGDTPEAIAETVQFRSRYYRLLQDGVTDLFVGAKRHAEARMGHALESRAHATWAESPTIDLWRGGVISPRHPETNSARQYEYTSDFLWSNTVHQAASACDDYFKWGDFLTGNGNDHAECGWLDRNYVGLALACSTGILNEVPYSYGAHWGMPKAINRRRQALVDTCGAFASPHYAMVQGVQHRDVDVLMLYPLDLVAVNERFGSWMTQYGYANQITTAKLLERGKVVNGAVELAGRRFTTLVATFEPFASPELLAMMRELVQSGGRVIWSGPPPATGRQAWEALFGVTYTPEGQPGFPMPGRQVQFIGTLAAVPPQIILTDFLVDYIYPVEPGQGTEMVAQVGKDVVGTCRPLPSGGQAVFLGFRPRDDQSASLGYETRTWFEVLSALGAYPGDDNTERLSRTGNYLFCRFPNGALAAAPHLCRLAETWPGGFHRDDEQDAELLRRFPPPDEIIRLNNCRVQGHEVTYEGAGAVTFRVDDQGNLLAFAGRDCTGITVDGRTFTLADKPVNALAFAPVPSERRIDANVLLQIRVEGDVVISLPVAGITRLVAEGPTPGSRGEEIPCRQEGDRLVFQVPDHAQGKWIYGFVR